MKNNKYIKYFLGGTRNMSIISRQACKKILQKDNDNRISKAAAEELAYILEDTAVTISETAHVFANHAGRKTVKKEDILFALETLEQK